MVDVCAIGSKHIGKGTPVFVEAVSLKRDFFAKHKLRRGLLGSLPVGPAFLWAIDAAEADAVRVLVVEDFDGLAVEVRDKGRRSCSQRQLVKQGVTGQP